MQNSSKVYLQPTVGSRGDFTKGILRPIEPDIIEPLDSGVKLKIAEMVGNSSFYVWAIKEGVRNRPQWEKMASGDLVLFDNRSGRIDLAANIIGTLENAQLVNLIWGEDPNSEIYPLVYFFEKPFSPRITLDDFNQCLGYDDSKMSQNFRLLDESQSISVIGLIQRSLDHPIEARPSMAETIASDISAIFQRSGISETERMELCRCRLGQGKFRDEVIHLWEADAIEGIDKADLLRASHIKPWRDCETDQERLDPHNGLLLLPNHDHLFDRGWITFEQTGRIKLSKKFTERDFEALGINEDIEIDIKSTQMEAYMAFHRKIVFKS